MESRETAYCPTCEQQRLFIRPGINHILHLILTLVTFGLWGPVWLILWLRNMLNPYAHPFRCAQCGTPKPRGA